VASSLVEPQRHTKSLLLQQTRAPISRGAGTTPVVVVAPAKPEPERIGRCTTPTAALGNGHSDHTGPSPNAWPITRMTALPLCRSASVTHWRSGTVGPPSPRHVVVTWGEHSSQQFGGAVGCARDGT
jgi:hypothetical protein